MNAPAPDAFFRLAPGCRLSTAEGQEDLLLIPEGALRLVGPARAIVELCADGRAFGDIVEALKQNFPSADPERIEAEVAALLTNLRDRGVIECP